MKINRKDFLTILNQTKSGLASKEVIEQSTSFIFSEGQVVTYNDEIAVHAKLMEGFDIDGAVPAKELLAVLTRFTGDEVELIGTENELQLKCGKGKAGIKLSTEIALPIENISIPKKWQTLSKDFLEGLKMCIPTAATDMTRPILTAIHFFTDYIESTDNNRITRWDWVEPLKPGQDILIPVGSCQALSRFQAVKFYHKDGWIHFLSEEGTVFSCRTILGEFPDLSPYMEIEAVGELTFPPNMNEMLERAGVFGTGMLDSDSTVFILIDDKGIMKIEGKNDFGWYEETCRIKWNAGATGFSIHPSHLQTILQSVRTAKIGVDRILFSTDSFVHVVALEAI